MPAFKFFIQSGNNFEGPFQTDQIEDLIKSGMLTRESMISADCKKLHAAGKVAKLKEAFENFTPRTQAILSPIDDELDEAVSMELSDADTNSNCNAERWRNLRVSTCAPSPKEDYLVIDTIFAVDSDSSSYWLFGGKDADPNRAFAKVKETLRETAFKMGGDDVVSCLHPG